MSPPLKWAGGKRWLAPRLAEIYAPHREKRLVALYRSLEFKVETLPASHLL